MVAVKPSQNNADLEYNSVELLICSAARLMEDHTTAFIGTGIPMLAAALAQHLYAPNLIPIFEFGGTGAILEDLPLAVGGENTFHKALVASGICDIVETAQRGFIEYGFLGGAQIDPYGNLNSTVIGDYHSPKVRLPGSGGGNDVGSHCWKTIAIMRQDERKFVEKVDFVTTPGYLDGPGGRERAGLPDGTGPYRVVTDLCVIGFQPDTLKMVVLASQPGVTQGEIQANTGFEIDFFVPLKENPPPSQAELRILREKIDPNRIYI